MKKGLLVLLTILLLCSPVMAARAIMTNNSASWLSVAVDSETNIALGTKTRDIWIHNGSAVDVCINLNAVALTPACIPSDGSFQLNGTASIHFQDLETENITLRSMSGAASPVSIIWSY